MKLFSNQTFSSTLSSACYHIFHREIQTSNQRNVCWQDDVGICSRVTHRITYSYKETDFEQKIRLC